MNAPLSFFPVDVAAGKGRAALVNVYGSILVCNEATAPFRLQLDDGAPFPFAAGFSIRNPDPFSRVSIINQSDTAALTVEFFAGQSYVDYGYQRVPKTRTKPSNGNLNAEATVSFPGIDSSNRRKSFQVQNDHATETLVVQSAGSAMAYVYPKQLPLVIETDADIRLLNPKLIGSGVVIPYVVTEVFYVTQ